MRKAVFVFMMHAHKKKGDEIGVKIGAGRGAVVSRILSQRGRDANQRQRSIRDRMGYVFSMPQTGIRRG